MGCIYPFTCLAFQSRFNLQGTRFRKQERKIAIPVYSAVVGIAEKKEQKRKKRSYLRG